MSLSACAHGNEARIAHGDRVFRASHGDGVVRALHSDGYVRAAHGDGVHATYGNGVRVAHGHGICAAHRQQGSPSYKPLIKRKLEMQPFSEPGCRLAHPAEERRSNPVAWAKRGDIIYLVSRRRLARAAEERHPPPVA
jgi:hypothetical protein